MTTKAIYQREYHPAGFVYRCSHIDNGWHCNNGIVGAVHFTVDISGFQSLKVYRFCSEHKEEALVHWTGDAILYDEMVRV
jgi:hypothetical protein